MPTILPFSIDSDFVSDFEGKSAVLQFYVFATREYPA